MDDKFWDELGVPLGGYNNTIDLDILNILELQTKTHYFSTDLVQELNLESKYVELIQYIICSADLAEYGTSPRGCWLTDKGEDFYQRYKKYHHILIKGL